VMGFEQFLPLEKRSLTVIGYGSKRRYRAMQEEVVMKNIPKNSQADNVPTGHTPIQYSTDTGKLQGKGWFAWLTKS